MEDLGPVPSDIAAGACRDKRKKSNSYFISIVESQKGSEVKEICS